MGEKMADRQIPEELFGLSQVEGISVSDGLLYCGSVRDFENFLESFYQDIDSRADEIEAAFRQGDLLYFTIRVHALKTTARVIGATGLAELSEALECAGKAEDKEFIQNNLNVLISLFKSYKIRLDGYMTERQNKRAIKKPISAEELEEAFSALREIAPTMNYDSLEMILEELSLYKLPVDKQLEINEIERLLRRLDWDGIDNVLFIKNAV